MAVDRGGLQYSINIDGNFREALSDFRSGIKDAKKSLDSLKTGAVKSAGAGRSREDAEELRNAVKAFRRGRAIIEREELASNRATQKAIEREMTDSRNRITKGQREAIKERAKEERAFQKELGRDFDRAAADRAKAEDRANRARASSQSAINRVLGDEVELKKRLVLLGDKIQTLNKQQLSALGFNTDAGRKVLASANAGDAVLSKVGGAVSLKQRIADFLQLGNAADKANSAGNRIAFTFRRLFGILAAFTAARLAVRGLLDMVRGIVNFNAQVEQTRIGIAALIIAVGAVSDATGASVNAAQSFALAQAEARRQTALLRADAFKTQATFEQLANTLQVAIAPGINAGLNLDQIREFSVRISQAASAIGLQQNQLSEEIRSLLSGTITPRTTRIATALGITNEDIKKAKEAGILFEFLRRKFSAFALAGNESLNTFDVILAKVKDTFSLILAQGGIEFFTKLKDALKDVLDSLGGIDKFSGEFVASPAAVAVAQAFGDALSSIVDEFNRLRAAFDVTSVVAGFRSLSEIVTNVIKLSGRVVEGFLKGFNDVAKIIGGVSLALKSLTGVDLFDVEGFGQVVTLITRIVTVFVSLSVVLATIKAIISAKAIVGFAAKLLEAKAAGKALLITLTALSKALLIIGAALASFEIGRFLFDEFRIVRETATGLVALFSRAWIEIKTGGLLAITAVQVGWQKFVNLVRQGLVVILTGLRNIASFALEAPALFPQGVVDTLTDSVVTLDNAINNLNADIEASTTVSRKAFLPLVKGTSELIGNLLNANKITKEFAVSSSKIANFAIGGKPAGVDEVRRLIENAESIASTLDRSPDAALKGAAAKIRFLSKSLVEDLAKDTPSLKFDVIFANRDESIRNLKAETSAIFNDIAKEFANANSIGSKSGINSPGAFFSAFLGFVKKDFQELDKLIANSTSSVREFLGVDGPKAFSDILQEIPAIISEQRDPLASNAALVKQTREELERTRDALSFGSATLGLSGPILDLRRSSFEAITEIRERTKTLDEEERRSLKQRADLARTRLDLQEKIAALSDQENDRVNQGVTAAERLFEIQRRIAAAEEATLIARATLDAARKDGQQEQVALAEQSVKLRVDETNELKKLLATEKAVADAILQGQSPEAAARIVDLTRRRVTLAGQEAVVERQISAIKQDRLAVERRVNEELANRLTLIAQQRSFDLGLDIDRATVELANLKRASEIRPGTADETINLINRQADLDTLQEQVRQAQLLRDIEQQNAAQTLKEAENRLASLVSMQAANNLLVADADLQRQITAEAGAVMSLQEALGRQQQLNTLLRAQEKERIEEAVRAQERAQFIVEQPVKAGITVALEEEAKTLTAYQTTLQHTRQAVASFSSFVSDSIASAFDPASNTSIRERFRQFLLQLAADIVNTLVRSAVVSTGQSILQGLAFAFAGGSAAGGPVPARGYARGGRPSGLDPSDTIPIWAAPGEWVIRAKSAAKYGSKVMASINQGLIDPMALRSLAGVAGAVSRQRKGVGFASGGSVTKATTTTPSQAAGPSVAIVAPSEENMNRLLSGGRNSMLRFFEDNAPALNSILGRNS